MTASPRTHVVLVPGFGGFDAFGDLRYYDRVTGLYHRWRGAAQPAGWTDPAAEPLPWAPADEARRAATELHYVDNHPTAGVETRAALLRAFLAKRVARGQILPHDRVVLVGHSTGGLDIRRLLDDLGRRGSVDVDGLDRGVPHDVLRGLVAGAVFLSVPHGGTNIADFLGEHPWLTARIVDALADALETGSLDWPWAVALPRVVTRDAGLTAAASDVLAAVQRRHDGDDPLARSDAEELLASVRLWLRRAGDDFLAIDTLRVEKGPKAVSLPPWPADVPVLSFATRGRRPFVDGAAFRRTPRGLPELLRAVPADASGAPSDVFYRAGWLLCSAGPFAGSGEAVAVADGATVHVEPWENDGIVNTASMIWPPSAETRLVDGDHGDVIGHFATVARTGLGERPGAYDAYDLLVSGSGFGPTAFVRVWREVFDFCARC